METDVPKGWNRERGGLSRNHKRFPGKKVGERRRRGLDKEQRAEAAQRLVVGRNGGKKWPGGEAAEEGA